MVPLKVTRTSYGALLGVKRNNVGCIGIFSAREFAVHTNGWRHSMRDIRATSISTIGESLVVLLDLESKSDSAYRISHD